MDMVQKKQPITLSDFLKNRILWKVYVLWFARRIVPLMLLQVAVIVVSLVPVFRHIIEVRKNK